MQGYGFNCIGMLHNSILELYHSHIILLNTKTASIWSGFHFYNDKFILYWKVEPETILLIISYYLRIVRKVEGV